MVAHDITRTNRAVRSLIESTHNARHRFLLMSYDRHRNLEMAGRYEELFAPDMMVCSTPSIGLRKCASACSWRFDFRRHCVCRHGRRKCRAKKVVHGAGLQSRVGAGRRRNLYRTHAHEPR